jgi:uncharacterized protein (DUF58 family)
MSTDRQLPEDPLALVQFAGLELIARQLVEGQMMGRHRSPYKGTSVEFVEHREYCPGDEIRHIDWRAFGKTGRYYIKEFEDETNLRAHLLFDVSGSMSYAGKQLSKFQYGKIVAASLAWLLLSQRDSVGLVTFDSAIRERLRPSASRDTWNQIIRILDATDPGEDTSMADAVQSILPTLQRRCMLILISDCLDSIDSLQNMLQRCRHANHEVVLFRIVAPEEEQFPFERPTQFRDLEHSGQRLLADPVRLRKEYLRQYNEFSNQLEKLCGNLGVDYTRILTSTPLQVSLGHWLAERVARDAFR